MENSPQKFCLSLVGVFSIMNFSTYSQRSARNSAYVCGMITHYISNCSGETERLCNLIDFDDPRVKGPFHRYCPIWCHKQNLLLQLLIPVGLSGRAY